MTRATTACPKCGSRRTELLIRKRFLRKPQAVLVCKAGGHAFSRTLKGDLLRKWRRAQ